MNALHAAAFGCVYLAALWTCARRMLFAFFPDFWTVDRQPEAARKKGAEGALGKPAIEAQEIVLLKYTPG